jgi:hypothetical protein
MSDWGRFNDQFRETFDETEERWRAARAKRKLTPLLKLSAPKPCKRSRMLQCRSKRLPSCRCGR